MGRAQPRPTMTIPPAVIYRRLMEIFAVYIIQHIYEM